MENNITFRKETQNDYQAVENLVRESFWNDTDQAAQSIMFCTCLETIQHL